MGHIRGACWVVGRNLISEIEAERSREHDPEKWEPVFGKDHAQARC